MNEKTIREVSEMVTSSINGLNIAVAKVYKENASEVNDELLKDLKVMIKNNDFKKIKAKLRESLELSKEKENASKRSNNG